MGKKRVWRRKEPDSPCKQICVIHPDAKICIGCHRTPEEISNWGLYKPQKRKTILAHLPQRGKEIKLRRGKRRRNRLNRSPENMM